MEKKEFIYQSSDERHAIHTIEWKPEKIQAVLQIVHGMNEYIDRYDDFARFLCDKGIYVVGNDHLGHGESVFSREELGHFEKAENVLDDILILKELTREKYPDVPYFILGHSMGSFFTRMFIEKYPEDLSGCIIMGTGYKPLPVLQSGQQLCFMTSRVKGWKYRSKTLNKIAVGSYNKKFEPARTSFEWLSKDRENIEKYSQDPLCQFVFTLRAYSQLFKTIAYIQEERHVQQIPPQLPLLIVSGSQDPVGDFGKGVLKVYLQLKNQVNDIKLRLYMVSRHEILNDVEHREVYEDIYEWIVNHMGK